VSHKSGHIIIRLKLAHTDAESADLDSGPCVSVDLPDDASEEACAQLARQAFRKLKGEPEE
jgi:hypothetical protein